MLRKLNRFPCSQPGFGIFGSSQGPVLLTQVLAPYIVLTDSVSRELSVRQNPKKLEQRRRRLVRNQEKCSIYLSEIC